MKNNTKTKKEKLATALRSNLLRRKKARKEQKNSHARTT